MHTLCKPILALLLISFCTSCSNENQSTELRNENARLQRQVDSLKQITGTIDSIKADTLVDKPTKAKPEITQRHTDGKLNAGKHNFTLQWISWNEPGSVTLQPSEDGWFSIEGGQKNRKNNDYIAINGVIKQISATELLFKGEIKSVIETNNGGQPCIKEGEKIFKTTKKRKYWRLQDMINCQGGGLTDYVDIYF